MITTADELEAVQITYVFKEKQHKSNENLTKSCDISPRRSRSSFRESLVKRLSLNFDRTKQNNNNNQLNGEQKIVNMLSKSRSMEHISDMKHDHLFDISAGGRKNQRHFSETRSDLTTVGLNSDDESSEHLVFHNDTDDEDAFERPKFSLVHQSTPLNRSLSFTDVKKTNGTKDKEESYIFSVPSFDLNRSKSLERMPSDKTKEESKPLKNDKTKTQHITK